MKKKTIFELGLFSLILLLSVGVSVVVVMSTGVKSCSIHDTDMSFSVDLERQLKAIIKKSILLDSAYLENREVEESLDAILERLVGAMEELPYEIEVIVIDSPAVNAAAFPGGLIVVYSGLIGFAYSAQEAAAVLAHELGHVASKDPVRKLARQVGISVVLGMLRGGGDATVAENLVRSILDAQYSQEQERRADEYAIKLLSRAGINPESLGSFFRRLSEYQSGGGNILLAYLGTHPQLEERIEKADLLSEAMITDIKSLDIDWESVRRNFPSIFD